MIHSKIKERAGKVLFAATAAICVLAVIAIFLFIIIKSIPALSKIGVFEFIFGTQWDPETTDKYTEALAGQYGVLTMIVGTIFSTAGALAVGGTLGYFTAVYLAFFCKGKLKHIFNFVINLLAGIPSVIYGFFGITVVSKLFYELSPTGSGSGLLLVSVVLGMMIMPTVVALTKTSLEAVPQSYYEGARALGATHEKAVFRTMVPAAKSGITAALILGIGRALGETMAVIMLAGNATVFPTGLFQSFRTLTANIVLEMGYAGEVHMGALFATGGILLVFVAIINILLGLVTSQKRKDKRQNKAKKSRDIFGFLHNKINFAKVGKYSSFACAIFAAVFLISLVLFILISGLPHISWQLLFGEYKYGGEISIFPAIVSTLMVIVVSILIAVPLGIATAIFLNEYTKKGSKVVKVIRSAIDILSGVPSIVYGLFGAIAFVALTGNQLSILAGALTISIMLLPTVVRSTEESLKSVPDSFREGSLALGAGKLRTIFKVVLPSAFPGIMSAVILSIGRVVSESAPFMFTMGASLKPMPTSFMDSGTSLAVALYVLASEGLHTEEAYATAAVLLILVTGLNFLAQYFGSKLNKKDKSKNNKKAKKIKGNNNNVQEEKATD